MGSDGRKHRASFAASNSMQKLGLPESDDSCRKCCLKGRHPISWWLSKRGKGKHGKGKVMMNDLQQHGKEGGKGKGSEGGKGIGKKNGEGKGKSKGNGKDEHRANRPDGHGQDDISEAEE